MTASGTGGVTGVILAGGLGRRMGGADKGLQPLAGRPLVAWTLERLAPQVDEILVNANRNPDRYAAFGHPVIADRLPDFPGPLAGLHAALRHTGRPLVATVPCDTPRLPHDLVARLRAALEAAGADVAIARAGGRLQPVFCLCRRGVLGHLEAYLAGGGRRVAGWYAGLPAVEVDFDTPDAFANANTPEDLDRLSSSGDCTRSLPVED